MPGTLADMDVLDHHERLTDEFLDSLVRCCGLEAPDVLREMADALERRLQDAIAASANC